MPDGCALPSGCETLAFRAAVASRVAAVPFSPLSKLEGNCPVIARSGSVWYDIVPADERRLALLTVLLTSLAHLAHRI